ncbi:MAG: hypothetical protein V1870_05740 [Candidatus Aenigmatarchaeota archaeon]
MDYNEIPAYLGVGTDFERDIINDPKWLKGIEWGTPRNGHPEGKVLYHIKDVLDNIDHGNYPADTKEKLRQLALIHDSFKHMVDFSESQKNHGQYAREFAEGYLSDEEMLRVIELHDKAYSIWKRGMREQNMEKAEKKAMELLDTLGDAKDLYIAFYDCDNATTGKSREHFYWFRSLRNHQETN